MPKTQVMVRLDDDTLAQLDANCLTHQRNRAQTVLLALKRFLDQSTTGFPENIAWDKPDDPDEPSDEQDTTLIPVQLADEGLDNPRAEHIRGPQSFPPPAAPEEKDAAVETAAQALERARENDPL